MQWSDASMLNAMEAVKTEGLKCSTAAKKFNVPRKTLESRIKGRVKHGVRPRPKTKLTQEEESALLEYVKKVCSLGFPMTKRICKACAWSVAKRSRPDCFKQKGPSEKW